MTSLVWLNIPLAIVVILAVVGIPLWMTFKRPHHSPDYSDANAHFRAKEARAKGQPVTVGGHVLIGRERPLAYATVTRRPRAGAPSTAARSRVPAARRSTRASA